MNVHKQQLKNRAEEISFQIMSFYFQFCMVLLLSLKSVTKCYNINDAKDLQILYHHCNIILGLEVANCKYELI